MGWGVPDKTEGSHAYWLQVGISGTQSIMYWECGILPGLGYLLVISKVVPKIWARTNSAILGRWMAEAAIWRGMEGRRCRFLGTGAINSCVLVLLGFGVRLDRPVFLVAAVLA